MKKNLLVLIFLFFYSVSLYANINNIQVKKIDEQVKIEELCKETYSSDGCIPYSDFLEKEYAEALEKDSARTISIYIMYIVSFLLILVYFLFVNDGYHHKNNYLLLLVLYSIIWGVILYNFSEKSQYSKTNSNDNIIRLTSILESIKKQQDKQNQLFYNKLQSDTKTLSVIVDVLSESNRKNSHNSKTFKKLIEKLDENIQKNNREMENIKELTPTATGTTIKIR